MKGILGMFLPRSLSETEEEIAVIKPSFPMVHPSHFLNLILKWEARVQKDFPFLHEDTGPPTPCLES